MRRSAVEFRTASPGPSDLLLVAEVSATTQDYESIIAYAADEAVAPVAAASAICLQDLIQ